MLVATKNDERGLTKRPVRACKHYEYHRAGRVHIVHGIDTRLVLLADAVFKAIFLSS